MPARGYAFVFATLAFTAIGQILLKWRATEVGRSLVTPGAVAYIIGMFSDLYVWFGLGMAVVASVCWMLAVQNLPVTVAYPFMALSFIIVPILAMFLLGESLSLGQGFGMLLIVAGVTLANLSK
ncbi:EamA family transporter [Roseococcus sp. YIM B11640]|uniref:EamA family transporter n=1 Tax=Roseococcus sp. YIM B11640 TaxID=3133973 RepID=UPI003C7D6209